MDPATLSFEQTLRRSGMSITKVRRAVFSALQDTEPLSMHEIIVRCSGTADRASVYRTILLFEKLGIVQRLQVGWKYKLELTDTFSHHHHHLTCSVCSRVVTLPEDGMLESQLHQLAVSAGFRPESHQLEIRGICAGCQAAGH